MPRPQIATPRHNVSLQLTGDWCEEGVVASALDPSVSNLHLPDLDVARS
jgi:hypothetical protein